MYFIVYLIVAVQLTGLHSTFYNGKDMFSIDFIAAANFQLLSIVGLLNWLQFLTLNYTIWNTASVIKIQINYTPWKLTTIIMGVKLRLWYKICISISCINLFANFIAPMQPRLLQVKWWKARSVILSCSRRKDVRKHWYIKILHQSYECEALLLTFISKSQPC